MEDQKLSEVYKRHIWEKFRLTLPEIILMTELQYHLCSNCREQRQLQVDMSKGNGAWSLTCRRCISKRHLWRGSVEGERPKRALRVSATPPSPV